MSQADAAALFDLGLRSRCTTADADAFRGHMLTEMFRMSLEDGMVMQIRRGSLRNHSPRVMAQFGRDKRFDIPTRTGYVRALKRKLDVEEPVLSVIPFTLALSTNPPEPTNWPPWPGPTQR